MSLHELRKDLQEIISIKKELDLNNLYNHSGSPFYKVDKKVIQEEGEQAIKEIIIELAKKYKRQRRFK